MPSIIQLLSGIESVRFYVDFEVALNKWRGYGGCIFHRSRIGKPWGVVDSASYPKGCTSAKLRALAVQALKKGGMTKPQIAEEMKDWID